MAEAALLGGIAMTDEKEVGRYPVDACGCAITLYSLVQILEVPRYLFESLSREDSGELDLAERIKRLTNSYGLVVSPESAPEISWHSRDLDFVHLCCKGLDDGRLFGKPAVWTYQEYFPSRCLRAIRNNLFIHNMFCESPFLTWYPPVGAAETFDTNNERLNFVRAVLNTDLAQLVEDHEEAMSRFIDKRLKS